MGYSASTKPISPQQLYIDYFYEQPPVGKSHSTASRLFSYCNPDEALISEDQTDRASGCPLTVPLRQTRLLSCNPEECKCKQNDKDDRTRGGGTGGSEIESGIEKPANICDSGLHHHNWEVFEVLRIREASIKPNLVPFDHSRAANWLSLVLIYFKNDIATCKQLKTMKGILQSMNVTNMVAELLMQSDQKDFSQHHTLDASNHDNRPQNSLVSSDDLSKISYCLPQVTRI